MDFGTLGPLVGIVGSVFAAAGAILLTWRGRARWEPSEQDIPSGPQRVGGLAIAVLVAVLYVITRQAGASDFLPGLAIALVVVCVAVLLTYSFVTSTQTFEDSRRRRRVIGGFTLTSRASKATTLQPNDPTSPSMPPPPVTIQQYFEEGGFDPDLVWTRQSRALAKVIFVALYLALVVSGTVALASAAILIEKSVPVAITTSSPSPTTGEIPTDSPGTSATPTASITPTASATPTAAPTLTSCVAPAGPSAFPRLTAADATITNAGGLCLLDATLYTVGTGEGLVLVVAGDTELMRFDMLEFDYYGEEGAGSGERGINFEPDVGVPAGLDIRLDLEGCTGAACGRLEIVFSASH